MQRVAPEDQVPPSYSSDIQLLQLFRPDPSPEPANLRQLQPLGELQLQSWFISLFQAALQSVRSHDHPYDLAARRFGDQHILSHELRQHPTGLEGDGENE